MKMSKNKFIRFVILLCGFCWPYFTLQAQHKPGLNCYTPGKDFQENDSPDCYLFTRQEADRAFARGCWEDASKLYRAAKLCRDATQKDRNALNVRIETCSDSAEAAIQAERDKAVRQARQAIASNRANDAQELLRKNDRTLAYRLAKFANEYIAPPKTNNPDCLQAIFDTWQQKTPETTEKIKPALPFCYELLHTQDDSVTVHFFEKNNKLFLFAFSPEKHELYQWEAPEYNLINTIKIDSTMKEFDLSPDGETMLFFNDYTFLLVKKGKYQYIRNLMSTKAWCFSDDSKTFFYFDPAKMTVSSLAPEEINPPRDKKGGRAANNILPKPGLKTTAIPARLAFSNQHLWLVYLDSVVYYSVVYDKTGKNNFSQAGSFELRFPKKDLLKYTNDNLIIDHSSQLAILNGYETFQTSKIRFGNGAYSSEADRLISGTLASCEKIWLASGNYSSSKFFMDRNDSLTQTIHLDAFTNVSWHKSGALAKENGANTGEWLAVSDGSGVLRIWRLTGNFSGAYQKLFTNPGIVTCSEDGSSFANCADNAPAEYLHTGQKSEKFEKIHFPADAYNFTTEVSNNGWVAFAALPNDTIFLYNREKSWSFMGFGLMQHVFRFDNTGKYFAYVTDNDSLDIYELDGKNIRHVAGKRFGSTIDGICFIPKKDAIIIQRTLYEGEAPGSITIPKIWYFKKPAQPLASVRMEKYYASLIGAGNDGETIFFTDGSTIRIFKLNSLADESAAVRQRKGVYVNAIAAHPTDKSIAVAYSDGAIICYHTETGKKLYQINAGLKSDGPAIESITNVAFSPHGDELIAVINKKQVHFFDLNVDKIQEHIALTGGTLIAFAPEQIGLWELDKALEYEGNFNKLAKSGDLPLIRSFFDFFNNQAKYSNNVTDVQYYCKRASDLYELLDPDSKKAQRNTLLNMYDDYLWKLLQRNKVSEAETVIRQQNTPARFKDALPLLRAGAHAALLQRDWKTAAKLYVDWITKFEEQSDQLYEDYVIRGQVTSELELLNDYGFLDGEQRRFMCMLFENIENLSEDFCLVEKSTMADADFLGTGETFLRWKIYQSIQQSRYAYNLPLGQSIQQLESTMQLAKKLETINKKEGRQTIENISLLLANVYHKAGIFDAQNTGPADSKFFTKALLLLEKQGSFSGARERTRLDSLSRIYFSRGNAYLQMNPGRAIEEYEHSLRIGAQLDAIYKQQNLNPTPLYSNLAHPLLTQIGKALLYQGQAPLEALSAFEKADSLVEIPTNNVNMAQAYLLNNDMVDASLSFGYIQNEYELARARAEIYQYSMPYKKDQQKYRQLNDYARILKEGFAENRPEFKQTLIDFYYFENMVNYFGRTSQFDSATVWSKNACLKFSELYKNTDKKDAAWQDLLHYWVRSTIYYTQFVNFSPSSPPKEKEEAITFSKTVIREAQTSFAAEINLININCGHIYLLQGDIPGAIRQYQLANNDVGYWQNNYYDYLLKDWRDLARAGLPIKGLKEVTAAVFPAGFIFMENDQEIIR